MRQCHEIHKAHGADVGLFGPDELKAKFPWLNVDDIALGSLGLSGEGWFDGPGLLAALRRKARSLGVTYVAQDAVGFTRAGGRVTGVKLADGSVLACDQAVVSAGAWSARVAGFLDIDLPIRPRKRMVWVFQCPDKLPNLPLMFEPLQATFLRPEGAGFLCGRSPGEDEPDPDEPPLEVDDSMFHDIIWPALAARVPAVEQLRVTGSWAGYYEYNIFDYNGVVGPHPSVDNIIFAAGFSGHGIQHSPATGRAVSELITEGRFVELDLSPLSFDRIVEGRKLIELGIY
jgi:glycine/D-amino acid oxidase-like deaminating enzyme